MCTSLQVKGLLLADCMTEEVLRQIYARYPLVQCSEYNSFCPDIPHVIVDDYTTSKLAVASLINKGCRKMGFFSAPYEYRYVQQRFRAFKTVLDSNEVTLCPEYIIQVADFSYQRILSAARNFFRLPDPPDGIFAVSDKHAHAVIKAALERGIRIPEELKVIGVDDTMYATLS
ncbi:MAG: substrate-binding domain-containing protein, partial [Clostridiales bacterium]|nr:substrate-binding domain-containing protein [Clostridiales bacterium]